MQVSGKAAETFLGRPDPSAWAALIHSADEGVASDGERALVKAWEQAGPHERIRITEEEIARDAAMLFERLEARSLLGDQAILTLRLSNEKLSKLITEAVAQEETRPGRYAAKLIITSGSLKKSSKLRKTFETASRAWAIQLFEDDTSDIRTVISESLSGYGVSISEDAISRLAEHLPGHRRLAHQELEKVALYAHGLDRRVEVADIDALSTSDIDHAITRLVHATFLGRPAEAVRELGKLEAAGQSPITLLRGLQRQATQLLDAEAANVRDSRAAGRLRPPVWSGQWPSFKSMMEIWRGRQLIHLIARIEDCEAQAKSSGPSAAPHSSNTDHGNAAVCRAELNFSCALPSAFGKHRQAAPGHGT